MLCRPPCPALRPYVSLIWVDEESVDEAHCDRFEYVLPSGAMHLVVRPGATPGRGWSGTEAFPIPSAVVGGIRDAPYRKAVMHGASVGTMLRPGAAAAIFGTAGGALARRHTSLRDLWPPAACDALEDQLTAAPTPASRLAIFEAVLARRLRDAPPADPFAAQAARGLARGVPVAALVRRAGCSHRHFVARFSEAIGVGPKTYQRLARFNRALDGLHAAPTIPLAELAAAHAYADQAHLTREFGGFAGLTPDRFRRLAPRHARHVPVLP